MKDKGRREALQLTPELIETYLKEMERKGRSISSIKNYRIVLMQVYENIPGEKLLQADTAAWWIHWMEEKQYSARTINARVSILNNFLQYLNRREWQSTAFCRKLDDMQPELSRAEYKRLLQAARQLGKEKAYLLIKTLGGTGIRIQDLSGLTVENLKKGNVPIHGSGVGRWIRVPELLQKELLDYARREGIRSGPLFVTREGTPLLKGSIWQYVKSVSDAAQVSEEKVTPRCLQKMYQSTYADIQSNVAKLVEQAYDQILEAEQLAVGWET